MSPARIPQVEPEWAEPESPYREILLTVLERTLREAITDRCEAASTKGDKAYWVADAKTFFHDRRGEALCDMLGLEIEWIRRLIRRARQARDH